MRYFFLFLIFWISCVQAQNVLVTCFDGDQVDIIDPATDTVIANIPLVGPRSIVVTPDNTRAYVSTDDTIEVIDLETSAIIDQLLLPATQDHLAISPDGSLIYSATATPLVGDNQIFIIDTATNSIAGMIAIGDAIVQDMEFTPDGSKVYASVFIGGMAEILVIDVASSTVSTTIAASAPRGVAVAPDGLKVYVADGSSVLVISTATDTVIKTIPVPGSPPTVGVAVTPDGTKVFATTGSNLNLIDTSTDDFVFTSFLNADSEFIEITADGTKAYTVQGANNTVGSINVGLNILFDIIPVANLPLDLAIQSAETPIFLEVNGVTTRNIFLTQTDIFNTITWLKPSDSVNPVTYFIFREADFTDLAGCVRGSGPLRFEDHNRGKNTVYNYFIIGVDSDGTQITGSTTGSVSVKTK